LKNFEKKYKKMNDKKLKKKMKRKKYKNFSFII
jgi:hypothetical protein